MDSYTLNSLCTSGYSISWNYTVSTNNNVVATNGAATSKGFLKIYNSSLVLQYSQNVTPATIVDNGADPSNPGFELFSVSFTSAFVSPPTSYFTSTNIIKLGATLVTDCSDIEAFSIAISPYTFNAHGGPLTNSCDRIDPIQIPAHTAPIRAFGEDPIGTCPGGYSYPHLQEIQYSITGGNTWVGESGSGTLSYVFAPGSIYANFNTAHLGYVDPYGVAELNIALPSGVTYTMLLRYRNINFNNAIGTYPGGIWPLPVFGAGGNCCAGAWSPISSFSVTY